MRKILIGILVGMSTWACQQAGAQSTQKVNNNTRKTNAENTGAMRTFHDFESQKLMGGRMNFANLKGKRVLVVNTASECGFTSQYEGLQKLYEKYGGENFTIIGFPSNDFGQQEPGSNEDIKKFCEKNYGVNFPMMAKTPVTGDEQHPVYAWLTHKGQNGQEDAKVTWNFNKFLINEKGEWVAHYPSKVKPLDNDIVAFAKEE